MEEFSTSSRSSFGGEPPRNSEPVEGEEFSDDSSYESARDGPHKNVEGDDVGSYSSGEEENVSGREEASYYDEEGDSDGTSRSSQNAAEEEDRSYNSGDDESYGSRSYGSRSYDSRSDGDSRSHDSRSYDSRSRGSQSYDSRSYDSRSYDSRSYDSRSYDSRSHSQRSQDSHSFHSGDVSRSYSRRSGSYGSRTSYPSQDSGSHDSQRSGEQQHDDWTGEEGSYHSSDYDSRMSLSRHSLEQISERTERSTEDELDLFDEGNRSLPAGQSSSEQPHPTGDSYSFPEDEPFPHEEFADGAMGWPDEQQEWEPPEIGDHDEIPFDDFEMNNSSSRRSNDAQGTAVDVQAPTSFASRSTSGASAVSTNDNEGEPGAAIDDVQPSSFGFEDDDDDAAFFSGNPNPASRRSLPEVLPTSPNKQEFEDDDTLFGRGQDHEQKHDDDDDDNDNFTFTGISQPFENVHDTAVGEEEMAFSFQDGSDKVDFGPREIGFDEEAFGTFDEEDISEQMRSPSVRSGFASGSSNSSRLHSRKASSVGSERVDDSVASFGDTSGSVPKAKPSTSQAKTASTSRQVDDPGDSIFPSLEQATKSSPTKEESRSQLESYFQEGDRLSEKAESIEQSEMTPHSKRAESIQSHPESSVLSEQTPSSRNEESIRSHSAKIMAGDEAFGETKQEIRSPTTQSRSDFVSGGSEANTPDSKADTFLSQSSIQEVYTNQKTLGTEETIRSNKTESIQSSLIESSDSFRIDNVPDTGSDTFLTKDDDESKKNAFFVHDAVRDNPVNSAMTETSRGADFQPLANKRFGSMGGTIVEGGAEQSNMNSVENDNVMSNDGFGFHDPFGVPISALSAEGSSQKSMAIVKQPISSSSPERAPRSLTGHPSSLPQENSITLHDVFGVDNSHFPTPHDSGAKRQTSSYSSSKSRSRPRSKSDSRTRISHSQHQTRRLSLSRKEHGSSRSLSRSHGSQSYSTRDSREQSVSKRSNSVSARSNRRSRSYSASDSRRGSYSERSGSMFSGSYSKDGSYSTRSPRDGSYSTRDSRDRSTQQQSYTDSNHDSFSSRTHSRGHRSSSQALSTRESSHHHKRPSHSSRSLNKSKSPSTRKGRPSSKTMRTASSKRNRLERPRSDRRHKPPPASTQFSPFGSSQSTTSTIEAQTGEDTSDVRARILRRAAPVLEEDLNADFLRASLEEEDERQRQRQQEDSMSRASSARSSSSGQSSASNDDSKERTARTTSTRESGLFANRALHTLKEVDVEMKQEMENVYVSVRNEGYLRAVDMAYLQLLKHRPRMRYLLSIGEWRHVHVLMLYARLFECECFAANIEQPREFQIAVPLSIPVLEPLQAALSGIGILEDAELGVRYIPIAKRLKPGTRYVGHDPQDVTEFLEWTQYDWNASWKQVELEREARREAAAQQGIQLPTKTFAEASTRQLMDWQSLALEKWLGWDEDLWYSYEQTAVILSRTVSFVHQERKNMRGNYSWLLPVIEEDEFGLVCRIPRRSIPREVWLMALLFGLCDLPSERTECWSCRSMPIKSDSEILESFLASSLMS